MAVQFTTSSKVTREDSFWLEPQDIHLDVDNNGRHDLPDIGWLIDSIEKNGQLTPCSIRKDGQRPVMVEGHSRWRAIVEINKTRKADQRLRVWCVLFRGNEVDALISGFTANRERNALTPVDEGYFIHRLTRYGKTMVEIAAITHETEEWCKQRLLLVELTPEAQAAVSSGALKPSAAKELSKMSADLQRKAVKERNAKGKVTPQAIRAAAGKEEVPRISIPKLRAEVDLFDAGTKHFPGDGSAEDFAKWLLKVLSGKIKL